MTKNDLYPKNFILNNLPEKTLSRYKKELEKVEMSLTQLLYQPWSKVSHVYFPETSVISVVSTLENGSGVETGIIGKEGILGATSIFAEEMSLGEATVQLGGEGWRMNIAAFKEFFEVDAEFRKIILAYVFTFIEQITQNSLCLCYHGIEKRLARWLLMLDDRTKDKKLVLTQEFLAQMLGVHRASVNKCANKLQNMNLISYVRGVIKILDREGLEDFACECYRTITEIENLSAKSEVLSK
ncbi:Crp/Fnr family transcriptional regulator [soil metagenome]